MSLRVDTSGWLQGVRHAASSHFNERPDEGRITLVVLHGISLPPGEFGGAFVEDFFTGRLDYSAHPYFKTIRELHVAPHLFLDRGGECVQLVSFQKRAWHAGRSCWAGREECNDYSIGIELEGTDMLPYTEFQYWALDRVLPALIEAYPGIGEQGVVGHADVAPGRKTDPGPAFDWARLHGALAASGYNLPARDWDSSRGRQA